MAGPNSTTQVVITMLAGIGAGPFTIPIPTAFTTIAGVSPADSFIRDIFVRGGFWDPASGTFYTVFQISSISAS